MKNLTRSDEKWLNNQRIASKIFIMLKLLLQALAIVSNVQLQDDHKEVSCNVCTGLKTCRQGIRTKCW